ncbi:MFS transporter [Microbacterium ulmi]|uniref:MFS transporter n=1 Tax=Microbacterium ulmi TaxID=179095 RepID=A0A7Y2LZN0_9MICO|nr:nitrate/nitrite transporter NarK [Microbacterium ulmi]NNH03801.1 MFS transporter [Microbacterium ulmi]
MTRATTARGGPATIVFIVACQSLQALSVGAISLFLPLIRSDLDITFTQSGAIAAVSLVVFAAMQIPAGWLADRFGAKLMFSSGLLGVLAMTCALAVFDSYGLILASQAASGFFRSLVFIPGMLLITHEFAENRRATAMGLYVAGGFSSNVVLSTVAPLLVDTWGWRAILLVCSAGGVLVVMAYILVGGPGPRAKGAGSLPLRSLVAMLRSPIMWGAGWLQIVRFGLANGMIFWLPTILVDDHGMTLREAGLVVAMAALLTAPANALGGYVSDRLRAPLTLIAVSLVVLVSSTTVVALVRDPVALCVAIAVQAVFVQVYFGPLFALPPRFLGAETAALTNGYSNLMANIGGLCAVWALGAVRDATGSFTWGLLGLAGLGASGVAVAISLRRGYPDPRHADRADARREGVRAVDLDRSVEIRRPE